MEEDINNIVFIGVQKDNRISVQYPEGSIEDNKIMLLTHGGHVGLFEWKYLRSIAKQPYKMMILSSGGITGNWDTVKVNSLQVFELVMLNQSDYNKLIFYKLMLPSTINTEVYFNTKIRGEETFNRNLWERKIETAKEVLKNSQKSKFAKLYSILHETFFEVHKQILGLEGWKNEEILGIIYKWFESDKINLDTSLMMRYGSSNTNIETLLEPDIRNDSEVYKKFKKTVEKIERKLINMILDLPKISYDNMISANQNINSFKRSLIEEIVEKSNHKILPFQIYSHTGHNQLITKWYVLDNTKMEYAKDLVINTCKKLREKLKY